LLVREEKPAEGPLLSLTSLAFYPQCAVILSNSSFTSPIASKRMCATWWKLILVPSVNVTWPLKVKVDSPFPNASPRVRVDLPVGAEPDDRHSGRVWRPVGGQHIDRDGTADRPRAFAASGFLGQRLPT
jgi:hypothetical protein